MSATATVERARAEHVQRRRDAEARSATRQALAEFCWPWRNPDLAAVVTLR